MDAEAKNLLPGQVRDDAEGGRGGLGVGSSLVDMLSENVKNWFNKQNGQTLTGALAYVPFILQSSYFEYSLDEQQIVIHKGTGGVVFSDASGFTALTEKLAKKSNGAELLSECLTRFFTPLIDLINAYRGDTIKFSGDALMIYFPAVDDTRGPKYNGVVPPHGTYGLPDLGPMATAVLRASACCIEIHRRLHMFDTQVDGVVLCLHIGVGCGEIQILQVGGVIPPETHVPRSEYIIAGPPLEQISIAEPLAKNGETCLSPQAWEFVKDCVIEGQPLEDRPDFHLLLRMDESKYTFPTVKFAAQLFDCRMETCFKLSELNITRRYIPSNVFKQIEGGTLNYVNEMRNISVIFISGSGLDVCQEKGPQKAQELMSSVQRACYAHEGTLNKFLIDDKGMLFLLVFGLPPLVHTDDPTRAVLACFEFVEVFKRLNLVGRFGVTTGRSYCGICGSPKRMEYTVLGDCVNLSARLMSSAPPLGIYCDEETSKRSTGEVIYTALAPIKVKGKANPIPIFQPKEKGAAAHIGLTPERKVRFPWYDYPLDGSDITRDDVVAYSKARVQHLCSITKWAGIVKVQEMLGGGFNKALHQSEQTIGTSPPTFKAPPGSPFAEGGIIVLEGPTGMGKIELAEHIVMYAAVRFQMLPIFGTMGPRPNGSIRLAVELLQSTLGVFRHLNSSVPKDDVQALQRVVPANLGSTLPILHAPLRGQALKGNTAAEILKTAVDVVIALLRILKDKTPILVVLQFGTGTSLFLKTREADEQTFWRVTTDLTKLVQQEKQIAGLILCKDGDHNSMAIKHAKENNSFVQLAKLSDDDITQYMSNYLNIPEQIVPNQLRQFVTKMTLGNPLYIRETIDQLLQDQHISVNRGANGQARSVECKGEQLAKINIAAWNHTAMVGGTVCILESLPPIEAAALKMSTCFMGPFALPDLAASKCSPWGGATRFDTLRLFRATRNLIQMGIIENVEAPPKDSRTDDDAASPRSRPFGDTQYFQMTNVLIRTVGAGMVLESQRKAVKRNALIDRVLKQDLPKRMDELAAKKLVHHIPWYYEQAMRRMM